MITDPSSSSASSSGAVIANEESVEPEPEATDADVLHDAMKNTTIRGSSRMDSDDHHHQYDDDYYHPGGYDDDDMMVDEVEGEGEYGDKKECLKHLHREMKNVLEREVVDILNEGSRKQLLGLHGIGKKRADLIIQVLTTDSLVPPLSSIAHDA